jgi:TRAP transporter TAXI family solute receptor
MSLSVTRRAFVAGAAALPLARLAVGADRLRLVVVTGGTGGVFYPYGGGLAKVLTDYVPNCQATAQVTGGSVDNVKLLAAGEVDIGFSTIDSAYDGLTGAAAYAEDGPQPIALIARLYDSFFHVVASADSGVTSVAGLKGKRVSVGSAGSSTESIADRVLAAAGLDPKADIGRDNLGVGESAGALKDGKVDAFFWIGGLPTAAVKDLAASGQPTIRFIPVADELAMLEQSYPGLYAPMTLAANTYPGQTADVAGIGVANVLAVAAEADDAMVTAVLTGIFDHLDQVHAIHPEAATLAIETAYAKLAVPFHPAADAFFAGRGIAAK